MKKLRSVWSMLIVLTAGQTYSFAAPQIPGEPQAKPIALVGGTIHVVSGPALSDGTIVFDDGKIVAVGPRGRIEIPDNTVTIDVAGKHVYPGLFDAYTNIGLVEINAVRATRDYSESGAINPNVSARVAVNPDSELIPVTRSNGVLLAVSAPTGGLISGKSSVMQLDGWTYEDMTLKADVGMHVRWPNMLPVDDWWEEKSALEQLKERDSRLKQIRQVFEDARAYQKARDANGEQQERDARWEAMLPVLKGELPLVVQANEIQQIQAVVAFAAEQKARLILLGGYDAPHCASLLKKHNVPVIVGAVYRLPGRRGDHYDSAFTLPERLRKAGIQYCISGVGRFGASNVRNLPYHAAMAAAFGLPRDEALKAITLHPAEVLGVADRVGSLDAGKDATLFVADGDILETPTQVEAAFIQGRNVDLNDRHKTLWLKYREKYRRQRKPVE